MKISSSSSSGLLNLNPRQETLVIVKAQHTFGNFTSRIHTFDKLWFKGTLKTSLTDESSSCRHHRLTRINLNSVGCIQCNDKNLLPITINHKFSADNHVKDLQRGIKYLLNVLFYPLVTIK